MVTVNKKILEITPYQPGKPIEEVKRQLGLRKVIKLASNENPLGASPMAVKAIKQGLINLNRYPEGSCFYLRRALSSRLKLKEENLLFGNGSDEIIDIILKAFSESNGEVLTADTTFLEYKIISQQNGRRVRRVPLKNFKYDLVRMRREINPATRVIFIANPNNPTGTYLNRDELADFIAGLPKRIAVVLDEAYFEFVEARDFASGIDYFRKNENILTLRTFSKAYGLAGLRIGYCIAQPRLIRYMERVRQPFNVNYPAQVGALAALGDRAFLRKSINNVRQGRNYIYNQLKRLGISFVASAANFVLIDLRQDAKPIFKAMLKKGVIVRDLEQYGLNNFIRVTIGTDEENRRFMKVLKETVASYSPTQKQ